MEDYVTKVQGFDGRDWGGLNIRDTDISGRAVQLIIPKGSMTDAQLSVIERVRTRALGHSEKPVNIVITEY